MQFDDDTHLVLQSTLNPTEAKIFVLFLPEEYQKHQDAIDRQKFLIAHPIYDLTPGEQVIMARFRQSAIDRDKDDLRDTETHINKVKRQFGWL